MSPLWAVTRWKCRRLPSLVVISNAKRYIFPAAREPPFITMLLAFRGVLVMSSKLYFLCQTVDVFPSYRW